MSAFSGVSQSQQDAVKAAALSKDEVDYRETGGMSRRCGTCVMFREGQDHDWCTLVKGDIDAYFVCDRWYGEDEKAEKHWHFDPHELRDSHGRWTRGGAAPSLSIPISFHHPKTEPKLDPSTGHISGYLYTYKPPVHDKKTGRVLDGDGNVIGRQLAKKEGDSGYSIRYVPTSTVLNGPYATRQDAADAVAAYHNMSVMHAYAAEKANDEGAASLERAMVSFAAGDHMSAAVSLIDAKMSDPADDDFSFHVNGIIQQLDKMSLPGPSTPRTPLKPKEPEKAPASAPPGATPWLKTGYVRTFNTRKNTEWARDRDIRLNEFTTTVSDRNSGEVLGTVHSEMVKNKEGVDRQVFTVTYADGTQVYKGVAQDVHERLVSYHNGRVAEARAAKDKRPVPKPESFPPSWALVAIDSHTSVDHVVGVSPETEIKMKREIKTAAGHQADFVPGLASKLTYTVTPLVKTKKGDSTVGLHYLESGKIQLHPSVTRTVSGDESYKAKKFDNDSGWWSGSEAEYSQADQVVAHETGHGVHYQVAKMSEQDRWDLWAAVSKAAGVPLPHSVEPASLGRWVKQNKTRLSREVSRYGVTDEDELQAEMWSEYTMKDNPRPAAKAYGDFVMKNLPDRMRPGSRVAQLAASGALSGDMQ